MDEYRKDQVAARLRSIARMAEWMKSSEYAVLDGLRDMHRAQGNQILIYVKDIAESLELLNDVFSPSQAETIFKEELNHHANQDVSFESQEMTNDPKF